MKTILGIETSCDETAAAILHQEEGRIQILSNVVASSASLQAKFGGVIPEQAAREQLKSMIPVLKSALEEAGVKFSDLDAIAMTQGPGLIGSLLVGVETAKVLSLNLNKPLIPVNHLLAHFYANWIDNPPTFPFIGLLVSGGHSDILLFKDHNLYQYLGGTRDDAAGECFDKSARLLGLGYPGGPKIAALAATGNPQAVKFPALMTQSQDFDYSFSGLKTAVANMVSNGLMNQYSLEDICASLQKTIIESLIKKVLLAAQEYKIEQIVVSGGVAANQTLITSLQKQFLGQVIAPTPKLCTDNGVMVAAAGFFTPPTPDPLSIQANPNLFFDLEST